MTWRNTHSTATAVLAAVLFALVTLPGAASASVSCDSVAGPGTDVQEFAESVAPGQTGCFRAGSYSFEELKVSTPRITLAAYPGETAILSGRVWVARGADGVTFSGLALDGRNSRDLPSPSVNAADTTFNEVDVTSHHASICFKLGDSQYGRAIGTVIENSRIHDCGRYPHTNMEHGIYIGQSDGVVIRDNWIYDNADRGVQVYPDAQGTQVVGNVIDGNGEGIVISGDGTTASSGTVVRNNVISNSKVRWNVEASWPGGVVGTANVVSENCIYADSGSAYYNQNGGVLPPAEGAKGFVSSTNLVAEPQFVDAGGDDFTLVPGSKCDLGRGSEGDSAAIVLSPSRTPTVAGKAGAGHRGRTVARVYLVGRAVRLSSRRVRIVKYQKGAWHRVARTHVRHNGRFRVSTRLLLAGKRGRVRLRAVVPGVISSRPIILRVRA